MYNKLSNIRVHMLFFYGGIGINTCALFLDISKYRFKTGFIFGFVPDNDFNGFGFFLFFFVFFFFFWGGGGRSVFNVLYINQTIKRNFMGGILRTRLIKNIIADKKNLEPKVYVPHFCIFDILQP